MNFGSYTNLTSLFTSIGNKLRKKVSFELKTQAEYNALVQAGTVDPNVDYHIYDADLTCAPIDDTTTASDKVWSSSKINTELSARDKLGAKNLLPYPYAYSSSTYAGITFTVNNGKITISGTATDNVSFLFVDKNSGIRFEGDYIYSRGNGDNSTIHVYFNGYDSNGDFISQLTNLLNVSEAKITVPSTFVKQEIGIYVPSGTVLNNPVIISPMLRLASIIDDTYEPYAMTNRELTNSHKSTVLTVSTSGWVTDTTSQSGTTLYKKEINLSHVYVPCPEVAIGASGSTLPTKAQQTAYDLVQYATVDSSTNKLYLYASAVPSTQFYIKVTGVD